MSRINIGFIFPEIKCLFIGFMNCGIKFIFRHFPDFSQKFPCPGYCFLFIIITKTPVAQHFKKRVMITISADFFEIIVFSTCTNTLLAVYNSEISRFCLFQKYILKLVHSSICEKQGRITNGNYRSRYNCFVIFLLKKFYKLLSDFFTAKHIFLLCILKTIQIIIKSFPL